MSCLRFAVEKSMSTTLVYAKYLVPITKRKSRSMKAGMDDFSSSACVTLWPFIRRSSRGESSSDVVYILYQSRISTRQGRPGAEVVFRNTSAVEYLDNWKPTSLGILQHRLQASAIAVQKEQPCN